MVVVKSNEAIVMLLSQHLAMVPFLLVWSLYQLMFEGTKYCGSFEGPSLVCYSCYFLFFSCALSHCQCIMAGAWLTLWDGCGWVKETANQRRCCYSQGDNSPGWGTWGLLAHRDIKKCTCDLNKHHKVSSTPSSKFFHHFWKELWTPKVLNNFVLLIQHILTVTRCWHQA